jgi:uncharacterized protein YqeY
MLTKEALEADLQSAMRAGDDVRKRTLRILLTEIKLVEVDRRGQLDEPALLAVIQKEAKSRRDTIEEAKRANRNDIVASNQAELDMLQNYLPQPLTPDELETLARQVIDEVEASGPEFVGKVMKVLMPQVQGRSEGKVVNALVRNLLNELQTDP